MRSSRLDCTFAWIYARRPQADDRQGEIEAYPTVVAIDLDVASID